jgi:hypothetical protein
MNTIAKVTGLVVLVAVAYSVVGGSAALAGPEPERDQPVQVLPLDPSLLDPSMDIAINPCLLIDCDDITQVQPTPTPTETEEPTPTPTETEEPTPTPTETDVPPTATPTDEPPDEPTDEPTDEPEDEPTDEPDLPNAGTGDGATSQDSQAVIALIGLGLVGLGIVGALVLTFRRKQTR